MWRKNENYFGGTKNVIYSNNNSTVHWTWSVTKKTQYLFINSPTRHFQPNHYILLKIVYFYRWHSCGKHWQYNQLNWKHQKTIIIANSMALGKIKNYGSIELIIKSILLYYWKIIHVYQNGRLKHRWLNIQYWFSIEIIEINWLSKNIIVINLIGGHESPKVKL